MSKHSRRDFLGSTLKSVAALGATGMLGSLGRLNAMSSGSSYKALVCVFLYGGNDGHNTVSPIDSYGAFANARSTLAIPKANLLQIVTKSGATYGLHPQLGALQSLYQSGKLAVVANVGMLAKPYPSPSSSTTPRQAFLSGLVPSPVALFSHSDQQDQWQSALPSGFTNTGWGGRIADAVQSMNSGVPFPPLVSTSANPLFCLGNQAWPMVVPPGGAATLGSLQGLPARAQAAQQLLSFDNGLKLVQAANTTMSRGQTMATTLNAALASTQPPPTTFPSSPTAAQLQMVARIIAARSALGASRQIFFVSMGGFDTHSDQLNTHAPLMAELNAALAAFYQATVDMGVDTDVTTFTTSEFGRTLMPNSIGGTDHAWGSHHFVLGGSVVGGDMYGQYPALSLNSSQDATGRGVIIPTTSVDEYAAPLATWFGVPASGLTGPNGVFPNLSSFTNQVLSFMG